MADDASTFVYDETLPFDHPHNKAVAKHYNWEIDPDFRWYRDKQGVLVTLDGSPPPHPVHLLR